MSYYTPDITGTNPDYAVDNAIYTIYTSSQRIEFDEPVYYNSIRINVVGTTRIPFVLGTDWEIVPETDIDYTATSKILNYSPSFSAVLVKSILVISPLPLTYKIAIFFQKLYPVVEKISVPEGNQIELTPDLIVSMLQRLANVELLVENVPNVNAESQTTPALLPVDVNETNTGNIVTETHLVNTFNRKNLVRPSCGAFFADSVTVTASGTVLNNGTDYLLVGFDKARTLSTTNTSGVYNFILLTYAFAGNVVVTCHAYGGEVTFYDMQAVSNSINNITSYLGNTQFLTPGNFGSNPVVQSLTSRIATLETTMRNLINSGSPSYADVTGTGTSTVQKIRSNDTNFHWWSIASLYTVSGSSSVVLADRMHFRMQMLTAHLSADVFINVDTTLANPFVIDTVSVNQDLGYVPFTSYATHAIVIPQFRVIYNSSTSSPSGILLQIGLALPSMSETIGIQDMSGTESAWILLQGSSTAILPSDGMVVLPNATYTWDPSFSGSVQFKHMMPNKTGYLAWGGALVLATMTAGTPTSLTPLIDANFNFADITKFRLEFTNNDGITCSIVDIPVSVYTSGTQIIGAGYMTSPADGAYIDFIVNLKNTAGVITLTLTPDSIPGSTSTITLRHVILLLE